MSIEVGYRFEMGYVVQFVLKEGTFARNFRVKDAEDGLFALKLFDFSKLSSSELTKDGTIREVEVLKNVCHQNLINMVDSGVTIIDGVKYGYLVTEFIPGQPLTKYLSQNNNITQYGISDLLKELANAVAHLHSLSVPIIHNEIDVENIHIDLSTGSPKPILIDFGNAKYVTDDFSSFSKRNINPFYAAPELENNLFSKKSDVFALGAVLYVMYNSQPPWFVSVPHYNMEDEKTKLLLFDSRKKMLSKPKSMTDHHFEVAKKALALNPNTRFASVNEFIDALDNPQSEYLGSVLNETINVGNAIGSNTASNKTGKGFGDVAGLDDLKEVIHHDIISVLNDPASAKEYNVKIPNGMLLWGPPGCGKTYFAQKMGEEIGYNFISIKPSDLGSIYVHGGQGKIKELFDSARENAPTIIFFDELDALVPNRTGSQNQSVSGEVNEFLTQMSNCADYGVFIVGATNRPDMIDSAVMRSGRMDKKFYLPRPDKEIRVSLFKHHLKDRPIDFGIDYEKFASLTDYYVSSDIAMICNEVAKLSWRSKEKINTDAVVEIIGSIRPSVNRQVLDEYEALRIKLEDGADSFTDTDNQRRSIGFK